MTITNLTAPTVSGTTQSGSVLTTTDGTWTSTDPLSFTYQWERCDAVGASCVDIGGATHTTYLLTGSDVGHTIRSRVLATETTPPLPGDKFASPSGSDSNPGTLAAPFRTLQKLQNALAAGEVGAMRGGTYGTNTTYHNLSASGTGGNPITITNYPSETPLILGYIEVNGSFNTFQNLTIDGSNSFLKSQSYSPCNGQFQALGITTHGSDLIFDHCEIYQSGLKGSGFLVSGDRLTVRYCKIHDIGFCLDFDHGIYVGHGAGHDIHHNWIWNNPHGWGIQIYPVVANSHFHHNVIDACGCGFVFGDDNGGTCVNNAVDHNVVSNSVGLTTPFGTISGQGVTSAGLTGAGNTFSTNDCWNNPIGSPAGVTLTGNITSDPQFVSAASRNYGIQAGSPIAGWGMWDGS